MSRLHHSPLTIHDSRFRLFLVDRPDLALTVVAAVRAHAVRRLRLVALGAQAHRGCRQGVVSAALRRTGLGMSTLRIRHDALYDSFFSCLSGASRGSFVLTLQSHVPVFRFVPHWAHSPLQSSRHNGFIGSTR